MTPSATADQTTETAAATSSTESETATSETSATADAQTSAEATAQKALEAKTGEEGKPDQPTEADKTTSETEPDYSKLAYPEGFTVEDSYREQIVAMAKSENFSPDQVQKLINRDAAQVETANKRLADQGETWQVEAKAATDYAQTQQHIEAAFGTDPEFHAALKDSGLLWHPLVRSFAAKFGSAMAEPSALSKGGQSSAELSQRERDMKDFPESSSEWAKE